jgi:hypothetical protein
MQRLAKDAREIGSVLGKLARLKYIVAASSDFEASSTLVLYHFEECSGTSAHDSGPAGRTARLENGAAWQPKGGSQ